MCADTSCLMAPVLLCGTNVCLGLWPCLCLNVSCHPLACLPPTLTVGLSPSGGLPWLGAGASCLMAPVLLHGLSGTCPDLSCGSSDGLTCLVGSVLVASLRLSLCPPLSGLRTLVFLHSLGLLHVAPCLCRLAHSLLSLGLRLPVLVTDLSRADVLTLGLRPRPSWPPGRLLTL